jgi:hypothetical protein
MSFGNRSNYASLKDAFGVLEFEEKQEPVYTIPTTTEVQQQPGPVGIESFEADNEQSHCKGCNCHSKISIKEWINELLNIILIAILLYIIIFKPKI